MFSDYVPWFRSDVHLHHVNPGVFMMMRFSGPQSEAVGKDVAELASAHDSWANFWFTI